MSASSLKFSDLRVTVQPESLGFQNTSELIADSQSRQWLGQKNAESAARYGLNMQQPDYHLFVLGKPGSGRRSLLQDLMIELAASRPVPQDLCVLHSMDAAIKPVILYLPAGAGRQLQHAYLDMRKWLLANVADSLNETAAGINQDWIQKTIDTAFVQAQSNLQLQQEVWRHVKAYFKQMQSEVESCLSVFLRSDNKSDHWKAELQYVLSIDRVNLLIDNAELVGAPVIIEENPTVSSLFGYLYHPLKNGKPHADFSCIVAGSLLRANGGFILLHIDDLLSNEVLWIKFRQFLRNLSVHVELVSCVPNTSASVFLQSQAFQTNVKIVLIGSAEDYYELQEDDPELMRHFRVKVDFCKSFLASEQTYKGFSVFIARLCTEAQLPHFSAAAVAYLLEESHRSVEHQKYQSAIFADTKALVLESGSQCVVRQGEVVEVIDIEAALHARDLRNNSPELLLRQSILDGEILIALSGSQVGRLNALTQIEWGDCQFGTPACITARTFPGEDGLLNVVREVDMSGPIHDKGVLILQNYLSALFSHIAPLALNASIVFEQEYAGIEGDSASCAEFYALLSSLSNVPLKQGIAITGAMNQFGEVLPVGAINDKIEGYFKLCVKAGLTGEQGVLIPQANRQHLVLHRDVVSAVKANRFAIYTMEHVMQGLELLSELPSGMSESGHHSGYSPDTVLGHVQKALIGFRRACQMTQHQHKVEHRRFPSRADK